MNELPPPGIWADSEAWLGEEAHGVSAEFAVAELRASGLVDIEWYRAAYDDPPALDAVSHYLMHGAAEGRLPNRYFDTDWYLQQNPQVRRAGINPLLHYIRHGEAEGCAPAPWFDLAWYAREHAAPAGQTLLRHFLDRRLTGAASPLPEFDAAWYLATYPDIAAAGVDPFEHYLLWGYREGRNPSAAFDTRYYQRRYLNGAQDENPLLHYRRVRHLLHLHTRPEPTETGVFEEVRRFTRPGPDFEEFQPLPRAAHRRAKLLAYYLPQFHAIAENDAWWGRGFTEWTSTARALPRFAGHYQPRVPRDLGHYSLTNTATLRRQIELARDGGLFGFIHYFYWFNGRRLLDRPTEAMLADPTLDFPFCLMWANENWTRRWDGSEQEVLISQDYRAADDPALVACLVRHFRDPRYIRIEGRPLMMIYRPALIPGGPATVARWRELFAGHGEAPLLVMAQSFDAMDPTQCGFDAAVEFPPHKLVADLATRNGELAWYDAAATAQVYAYADVVAASLAEPAPAYPLIKTATPSWDNDARRQGAGLVLHGSTPASYQAWLAALIERAQAAPFHGERMVCINAWNEWAEGAYLEPDLHFGAAYLNATARAVTRCAAATAPGLLLVGHDAFPAGAQMLLLHLARTLRREHGLAVELLLLGDGRLRPQYTEAAPTGVVTEPALLPAHLAACRARGIAAAVVNTCAAAQVVPLLRDAGIAPTLLVHELPRLIEEKGLLPAARLGTAAAEHVVFAAAAVRDAVASLLPLDPARVRILPQGLYHDAAPHPDARAAKRAQLGLDATTPLVLGLGRGDLRKGFDLFLQVWRAVRRRRRGVVFCWVGDIDPGLRVYLAPEIDAAVATGLFHCPGFAADVADWLAAADAFCLPSREDPFPTAVLEAMAAGLPTVAFAGAGGIPDLLRQHAAGVAVPMGDTERMAKALIDALAPAAAPDARARLAGIARTAFAFPRYARDLLAVAMPDRARISVVVPSYNYARHLETRLASIFAQTHPVEEVIVLDDASTDDSVAIARLVAGEHRRAVTVEVNRVNSGSAFGQWRRGAAMARGDFVWIAEADDAAEPGFLAALAARLDAAPDLDMILCDSRVVDEAGREIRPSYQDYFAASGAAALARDGLFAARGFARLFLAERNLVLNVSAVLFRRQALLAALARCGEDLAAFRVAGDWRLYVELLAASEGSVAWVAAPLNLHRRHATSATGRLAPAEHVDEIARVHAVVGARVGADAALQARQAAYRARVAAELGVTCAPLGVTRAPGAAAVSPAPPRKRQRRR